MRTRNARLRTLGVPPAVPLGQSARALGIVNRLPIEEAQASDHAAMPAV
jgi:hypothetical protein